MFSTEITTSTVSPGFPDTLLTVNVGSSAAKTFIVADTANSITNSAYQFGYDMDAIVGGAHNGAADAMRHCYLMCRMTKTFGSTIADVIGKNHEAAGDRQGQPAKERIMDLKNNTVGIACGDFSAKCSDACIEKYNTGQLFGLDGIKADNPIKTKQGSSDASNY